MLGKHNFKCNRCTNFFFVNQTDFFHGRQKSVLQYFKMYIFYLSQNVCHYSCLWLRPLFNRNVIFKTTTHCCLWFLWYPPASKSALNHKTQQLDKVLHLLVLSDTQMSPQGAYSQSPNINRETDWISLF